MLGVPGPASVIRPIEGVAVAPRSPAPKRARAFRANRRAARENRVKFDLGSVASLTRRAERLRTERWLAPLLQRYQVLVRSARCRQRWKTPDEELRLLEATVERMAREWDRFVQHQIDVARGK